MTERTERFTMTSEPEQLIRMRSWLWTALVSEELPLEDCSSLLVAAGELCTNSIKHAYAGEGGHPIRVTMIAEAERIVLQVEDDGAPFDPQGYVPPDLDATPEHGLGLYLVKSIADGLSVEVGPERGTRWRLIKYRPGHAPDAAAAGSS